MSQKHSCENILHPYLKQMNTVGVSFIWYAYSDSDKTKHTVPVSHDSGQSPAYEKVWYLLAIYISLLTKCGYHTVHQDIHTHSINATYEMHARINSCMRGQCHLGYSPMVPRQS